MNDEKNIGNNENQYANSFNEFGLFKDYYNKTYTSDEVFIFGNKMDTFENVSILLDNKYLTNIHDNYNITNHRQLTYLALSNYHGYLDPNFVESINPFWLQFPPPSTNAHYSFAFVYLTMMVIGMIGNALVILMFIRCRSLRTPANTLVINLAVSDIMMLAKAPIMIYNSFHVGPALGDYVCRFYGFIGGLTGVASIATLTAISIDRYYVVVYPLDPLRSTTKLRARIMVAIAWLYSTFFAIIPALDIGLSKYVPEGYLTSCSFDYLDKTLSARIFMFIFFIFAWLVPFSVITFCYFYILKVVIAAKKIQSNKDKNKTEIKLCIIVLGVIGLWFMAWTPYAIVALFGISGNENKLTPLSSMIPAIFCKSAACIDPYVYAMTHPRFRMEFKRMLNKQEQFSRYQTSYSRCTSIARSTRIVRDSSVIVSTTTATTLNNGHNGINNELINERQQQFRHKQKQVNKIDELSIPSISLVIEETPDL